MRKEMHAMIDNGDDSLIANLYDIAKEMNDIPEERLRLIMQEREDHLNGKGTSYSWEEAKTIVRSERPKV